HTEEPCNVLKGEYVIGFECSACGADLGNCLTRKGEAAEARRIEEAYAAQEAAYAAEWEAMQQAVREHMASPECARDREYIWEPTPVQVRQGYTRKTRTCCEAGEVLQTAVGYYPPWWSEPSPDDEAVPVHMPDDLSF